MQFFTYYFNHLIGYTIVALGRQRRYLIVSLAALVFNVIVNLAVIPKYSYFGAAAVTVLTEGLILIITVAFVFKVIGVAPSVTQFPKTAIELIKRRGKIF